MAITIKSKYLFLAILIALGGIFFLGRYTGHKRADKASEALVLALNDTISSYKYKVGSLNMTAFEQAQIITTQKEAIKRGDLERKELRALNLKLVSEINELNLQVDTLLENVNHSGTIIIVQQETIDSLNRVANVSKISQKAILLPFEFIRKDTWLDLKGNFNKDGVLDIGLKLEADVEVWSGYKKGEKNPTAIVTTTNPYISILNIKSQKFDFPKPRKIGVGIQGGYGIGNSGLTPYVGLGISYNIFTF